jgi:endo-1,4-beta-xylanase
MRSNRLAVLAAVALLSRAACAASEDIPLRGLMEARGRMIGAAVDAQALSGEPNYARVLSDQFGLLTPENAMKFDQVHPRPGFEAESYDFSQADGIVAFARAHGMNVRGHTLVWYRAVPAWAAKISSPDHLREILRNHIQTVAGHFKDQVYCWDVVNEAVASDGSMRKSVWSALGPDYVADAFRWAHAADPDAKLFYNDYDAEKSPAKADGIYRLLKSLKDAGVPIDGVGFQMHTIAGPQAGDVGALLHRFAALGLEVHITEMDVSTVDLGTAIDGALGRPLGPSDLALQGEVYARALRSCLSEPACKAFVLWGFTDKHTWLPFFQPLIFDKQYRPKPAFDALEKELKRSE